MASLTNRPSGVKVQAVKGTRGRITLQTNNKAFKVFKDLRSDDRRVLDSIMTYISTNTNHIIVDGDTLKLLKRDTGYTVATIRNSISRLKQSNLINKLQLDHEFIVNPLLAVKGDEQKVWEFIQMIHHKGNIPREAIVLNMGFNKFK